MSEQLTGPAHYKCPVSYFNTHLILWIHSTTKPRKLVLNDYNDETLVFHAHKH